MFTGRYPRGLFDFVVGVGRWWLRVEAFALLLVADRYPPSPLPETRERPGTACPGHASSPAAPAILAVGGMVRVALSVMPEAFYRLLALPKGIAMIAPGSSVWHEQRISVWRSPSTPG